MLPTPCVIRIRASVLRRWGRGRCAIQHDPVMPARDPHFASRASASSHLSTFRLVTTRRARLAPNHRVVTNPKLALLLEELEGFVDCGCSAAASRSSRVRAVRSRSSSPSRMNLNQGHVAGSRSAQVPATQWYGSSQGTRSHAWPLVGCATQIPLLPLKEQTFPDAQGGATTPCRKR